MVAWRFSFRRRFQQWLFRLAPDDHLPIILKQRRIFILPTRTGILFAVVLLVMMIGAINYNLSLGHALVFLLAGLGLVAMVHTFRNLLGLELTPMRVDPVFAGEIARFPVLIRNRRTYDRRALELAFDGEPCVLVNVDPDCETLAALPCTTHVRGRFSPGRITLASRYPLGFFRAWSYPYPRFSCLVYPSPIDTPLPPAAARAHEGHRTGDIGQEDFTGLRLRQPNESPRHVAWKAMARDPDNRPLLVKQFAGGATGHLVLDWAMTEHGGSTEHRLSILCGWVLAADRLMIRYGLRLPGRTIDAAHGPAHREACLEALALHG